MATPNERPGGRIRVVPPRSGAVRVLRPLERLGPGRIRDRARRTTAGSPSRGPRAPCLAALAGGAVEVRGTLAGRPSESGRIFPVARPRDECSHGEADDGKETIPEVTRTGRLAGTQNPRSAFDRCFARTASCFARRSGLRATLG